MHKGALCASCFWLFSSTGYGVGVGVIGVNGVFIWAAQCDAVKELSDFDTEALVSLFELGSDKVRHSAYVSKARTCIYCGNFSFILPKSKRWPQFGGRGE